MVKTARTTGRFLRLPFLAAALVAVLCSPAGAGADITDRIVAVVNSDVIVLSELNEAFHPFQKRVEEGYRGGDKAQVLEQAKRQLLRSLVEGRLIEQEAQRLGIKLAEEDVMKLLRDMLGRRQMTMEALTRSLEKDGLSFEDYLRDFRAQVIRMRVLTREVRSKITVMEEEIGAYYREHQSEYEGKEAVRLRQILIRAPEGMPAGEKDKLRAEAAVIVQRLKSGESFDALALQFHRGSPALAGPGGDLGFVERGTMLPEVDALAFRMEIGAVSDVIESPLGFHIIQVLDRKGAGLKPLETVREEIREKIEEEKMSKRYEEWIEALWKKSHIDLRL